MDAFAEQLLEFTKVIVEIDGQRTKPKYWFPGRIVKDNLTSNEFKESAGPLSMGTMEDPTTFTTRNEISNSKSTAVNPSVSINNGTEREKEIVPVNKRNDSPFDCPQMNSTWIQNAETLMLSLQRLPLESPGLGLCRLPDFSSRQRASFLYVMQLSRLLCGFRLFVHRVHGSTTIIGVFGH